MSLKYYRLFDILQRREISKTQFGEMIGVSSATVAKLSAHKPVNMDILNRICEVLNVQPGDVLEYVPDNKEG